MSFVCDESTLYRASAAMIVLVGLVAPLSAERIFTDTIPGFITDAPFGPETYQTGGGSGGATLVFGLGSTPLIIAGGGGDGGAGDCRFNGANAIGPATVGCNGGSFPYGFSGGGAEVYIVVQSSRPF